MSGIPVIDLDELEQPVARVRIKGTEYDVLPASGRAADILQQINLTYQIKDDDERQRAIAEIDIPKLQDEIVREGVPTLPVDVKPNVAQRNKIIGLMTGVQERVRAAIDGHEKNADGP
jgi:hypothetical protein